MHDKAGALDKIVLPIALEWYITDSCNLACRYCRSENPVYRPADYGAAVEKIIALAPKHIWLGGGEPTLVSGLPGLLKRVKSALNVSIGLSTNLTLPETAARAMPFVDDMIISLDTADEAVSRFYRCVSPAEILGNIAGLCRIKKRDGLGVNITVNSVVYKDSLEGAGLEKLNDELNAIDPAIWHIFCPVYPETQEGSILKDEKMTARFFELAERLKGSGRKIMVDFPSGKKERSLATGPVKCYRRYFRAQMSEKGELFSPCPDAPADNPECGSPCSCAGFIDDILRAGLKGGLEGSPVKGRFTKDEVSRLHAFVRDNIDRAAELGSFGGLMKNNGEAI
jgi:organic radical activating enzyme